jgi:alpha-beta hydrolase superfamily lysophospholipase
MGRLLSRVWPTFSLETGMDLTGLARDPAVTERVLADPLFHRRGSARLSTELTATITRVRNAAPRYPVPVLVLHGGADRMVPPGGSREFVASARLTSVRMIEYPGAYHALLADHGGGRVLADLAAWLAEHV